MPTLYVDLIILKAHFANVRYTCLYLFEWSVEEFQVLAVLRQHQSTNKAPAASFVHHLNSQLAATGC